MAQLLYGWNVLERRLEHEKYNTNAIAATKALRYNTKCFLAMRTSNGRYCYEATKKAPSSYGANLQFVWRKR